MNKIVVVALCGLFFICTAHAEVGIKASNREIGLHIGRQNTDYTEYDKYGMTTTGVLDTENGSQPAVRLYYSLQQDVGTVSDVYATASLSWAKGKSNYDGYLQDLNTGTLTPYQTRTHVSNTDFELRLGKGFVFFKDKTLQLTPYVSYAYHEWERDSSRDTYGYLEVYDHKALSLGLLTQLVILPKLVATADVSYGKTYGAEMTVEHSTNFDLGSKGVTSYGLALDYALPDLWHVNGGYRVTKFKYGQSPVINGFIEPDSSTTLKSIYVGAGLSF